MLLSGICTTMYYYDTSHRYDINNSCFRVMFWSHASVVNNYTEAIAMKRKMEHRNDDRNWDPFSILIN